jgi:hypothetical protein
LNLHEPNWKDLEGGEGDWEGDRLSKFSKGQTIAIFLVDLLDDMSKESKSAPYKCTPDLLAKFPAAAQYYTWLAGYSDKSLGKIPKLPGCRTKLDSLVQNLLKKPSRVSKEERTLFSDWINPRIQTVMAKPCKDSRLYAIQAAITAGDMVGGQVRVETGNLKVELLKRLVVEKIDGFEAWDFKGPDGNWYEVDSNLIGATRSDMLRHRSTGKLFDFSKGGSKPDLRIVASKKVILVAEIKGRKDLANLWESWMGTVIQHLESWVTQYPDAVRGVFMTTFNRDSIEGATKDRVPRRGFKTLHSEGLLHFALNLTHVQAEQGDQLAEFRYLLNRCLEV